MEPKVDPLCHIVMRMKGNVKNSSNMDRYLQAKSKIKTGSPTHDILVNAVREIFQKGDFFGNGNTSSGEYIQADCSIWIGLPGAPMDGKWKNIPFHANGWHLVIDGDTTRQLASMEEPSVMELFKNARHTKNGKPQPCCSNVPEHIGNPLLCCAPDECAIILKLPIVDNELLAALEPYITKDDLELLRMKRKLSKRSRVESGKGQTGSQKSKKAKTRSKPGEVKRNSKRKMAEHNDEADENEKALVIEVSEAKRRKTTKQEESNEMRNSLGSEAQLGASEWDDYTCNIG